MAISLIVEYGIKTLKVHWFFLWVALRFHIIHVKSILKIIILFPLVKSINSYFPFGLHLQLLVILEEYGIQCKLAFIFQSWNSSSKVIHCDLLVLWKVSNLCTWKVPDPKKWIFLIIFCSHFWCSYIALHNSWLDMISRWSGE